MAFLADIAMQGTQTRGASHPQSSRADTGGRIFAIWETRKPEEGVSIADTLQYPPRLPTDVANPRQFLSTYVQSDDLKTTPPVCIRKWRCMQPC